EGVSERRRRKRKKKKEDDAAHKAPEQQLQETVKRKLDSARSPLNGEQNGICDGGSYSPTPKRVRKEGSGGLDSLTGLPNNNNNNNVPPISPLHHQMDIKPLLGGPNTSTGKNTANSNGNHVGPASDDLGKNGGNHLQDMKLNGSLDLEDSFGLLKDLKQEPLDDGGVMESSDPQSLSNQNKLFSDINLNDQEWQELIDELANTVPEDDMHDLFNEDFEDKKEAESLMGFVCVWTPQVRPSSSGPQFATTANGTPPQQPLQQSPAVAMASGSPLHNCVARSPQTPTQAQTQAVSRPGNGYMMNPGPGVSQAGTGPGAAGVAPGGQPVGPVTPELSPAEQLKAMAQQRAKLLQQKQQQQAANWSPAGAPTSPYNSGPFNQDKPNSPMMYPPQAFNTPQGPLVTGMATNNGPKAPMNNYLPHNHMGMMGQQQPNSINQNTLSKQQQQQQQQTAAMLSYNNTKPLSHFSGSGVDHLGQRMTPPMGGNNQVKNPMMPPYMGGAGGGGQGAGPGQTQGPIPGQTAHLSEEQKRMLLMKQKVLNQNMPYSAMQPHGQAHVSGLELSCSQILSRGSKDGEGREVKEGENGGGKTETETAQTEGVQQGEDEGKDRKSEKRSEMQGYPFFLPQQVLLFLRLLRLRESQKSSNRVKSRERERRYCRTGGITFTVGPPSEGEGVGAGRRDEIIGGRGVIVASRRLYHPERDQNLRTEWLRQSGGGGGSGGEAVKPASTAAVST
ncbi:hypothetical protein FQN60_011604, partial [Etheostoma spectabile]